MSFSLLHGLTSLFSLFLSGSPEPSQQLLSQQKVGRAWALQGGVQASQNLSQQASPLAPPQQAVPLAAKSWP